MGDSSKPVDRRTMLAGASAVGALAAAATLLPDTAAGYRLTEHVKRYYATARI